MIDINKPMCVNRGGFNQPVDYVANAQGKIIIRHKGHLMEFDEITGLSFNKSLKLRNIPVTHRRLAVLYVYKGGPPAGALFCDTAGIDQFVKFNPVKVISIQWVDLTEGVFEGSIG